MPPAQTDGRSSNATRADSAFLHSFSATAIRTVSTALMNLNLFANYILVRFTTFLLNKDYSISLLDLRVVVINGLFLSNQKPRNYYRPLTIQ